MSGKKNNQSSVFGEKTPQKEFLKNSLYCVAAVYIYVDDILCIFQVILKGLVSLALSFRNKTILLKSEELSCVGSDGFSGDFLKYIL